MKLTKEETLLVVKLLNNEIDGLEQEPEHEEEIQSELKPLRDFLDKIAMYEQKQTQKWADFVPR